ncbi:Brp/Blh family beta-carotene 15,15'-dioxygenase [Pelagibacteraceae bacterium]|jgi:Brp/Blh family beta-carotene 15,15'-monooxygenase|nr:Brp/Blh family beta-carotene 15,15'-dioxygenase [Pelagibacteraceae bacterium]
MTEEINKKFNFNSNLILLFTGLTFSLMLLYYGSILSKNFLSTSICLFLILTVGISHGALDDIKGYKVLKFYKIKNKYIFYFNYIFLAFIVILIWFFFPTFALVLFLIVAAYHFGKEDCWGVPIKKSNLNPLKFFLKGSLIILAPLWLSFEETVAIFNILGVKNEMFFSFLIILNNNSILLALVALSVISNIFINRKLKHLTGFVWETTCILGLYDTFNPLIAFTIYFCFLHSFRHSISLTYELNIDIADFIKKAWPLTVITAFFFFIGLYILTGFQKIDIDSSIINVIFIGLASLTFPHILLEYIMEKNEK